MKLSQLILAGVLAGALVSGAPAFAQGGDNGNGHGNGHGKHHGDDDNDRDDYFYKHHEKDIRGMLELLLPHFEAVILTRYSSNPRGVPIAELEAIAAQI